MLRLALVAGLLTLAGATPATATTITFDDQPNGTVLGEQYAAQGVTFASDEVTGDPGDPLSIFEPGADKAQSGTKTAGVSGCGSEVCRSEVHVTARFAFLHKDLSLYLAARVNGSRYRVRAYGLAGSSGTPKLLASQTVDTGTTLKLVSFSRPTYDIAFLDIVTDPLYDARPGLALDTLTFDAGDPNATPDLALSATPLKPDGTVGLRAGTPRDLKIKVTRFNGASGPVSLSVSDDPDFVEQVTPTSTSGSTATLRLNPPKNLSAEPPARTVTVTATPASVQAGTVPRSVTIPVGLLRAFDADAPDVRLDACGQGAVTADVFMPDPLGTPQPPDDDGPVTLAVEGAPPGSTVGVTPSSIPRPSGIDATKVRVSLDLPPGTTTAPVLVARQPLHADKRVPLTLTPGAPPRVDAISPGDGVAPQGLQPGSLVQLDGASFCGNPTVYFGNLEATARPEAVSADGTRMAVRVPRLATSGQVHVVSAGQDAVAPTGAPDDLFPIRTYRNTHGFRFENYALDDLQFKHAVALYGESATYLDPCVFIFAGCVKLPIADPTALAYFAIADTILAGDPGDAHCFGMSLFSQRLMGASPLTLLSYGVPFPRVPNFQVDPSVLNATDRPSEQLDFDLKYHHLAQLSVEGLMRFGREGVENQFAFAPQIEAQAREFLAKGEFPTVSIRVGSRGHTMVVYDVEPSADPSADFYLRVYDPNKPFGPGLGKGFDPLAPADSVTTTSASLAASETISRIAVSGGRWTYPGLTITSTGEPWSNDIAQLAIVGAGEIPRQPSIPALSGLFDLVSFGTGTETVSLTEGRTDLTTQSRPRATPLVVQDAGATPRNAWVITHGKPFTQVVRGTSPGRYDGGVVGPGFSARVEGLATDAKHADTFTFDQRAKRASFATAGPAKALDLTLTARAGGGGNARAAAAGREVQTVRVQAKAADGALAIDGGQVVYTQKGAPADVALTLGWVGPNGTPGTFTAPRVRVGRGETLRLAPKSWRALSDTTATLRLAGKGAKARVRTLRGKRGGPKLARALTLTAAAPKGEPVTAKVATTLAKGLPAGTTVAGELRVTKGRRVVARKALRSLEPGGALFDGPLRTLAKGTYRVQVKLLVVAGGAQPRTQTLTRARTLRVR